MMNHNSVMPLKRVLTFSPLAIASVLIAGLTLSTNQSALAMGSELFSSSMSDISEPLQHKDAHDPNAHDPDAHDPDAHDPEEEEIPDAGLVVIASPYSVAETGDRFEALLTERGVTVFARIDHAAGAAGVDLTLRPTELIIFGNPRVGTPLMQCAQSMAIDLPQKLLIWENEVGDVYLGYNNPRYLASRHGIVGCEEAIARVEQILLGLTNVLVSEETEE